MLLASFRSTMRTFYGQTRSEVPVRMFSNKGLDKLFFDAKTKIFKFLGTEQKLMALTLLACSRCDIACTAYINLGQASTSIQWSNVSKLNQEQN